MGYVATIYGRDGARDVRIHAETRSEAFIALAALWLPGEPRGYVIVSSEERDDPAEGRPAPLTAPSP